MEIETWPIDKVIPYDTNPRVCPEKAVAKVAESLRTYGWRQPIVVDTEGVIIAGHTRRKAAELLGLKTVPVHVAHDMDPDDVRAYRIADNRVAEETSWDKDLLALEISGLNDAGFDLGALGFDTDQLDELLAFDPDAPAATGASPPMAPGEAKAKLADRFGLPPFSVLNAREGWWQDRKRAWLGLGIQSELGRGGDLIPNGGGQRQPRAVCGRGASPGGAPRPSMTYGKDRARGDGRGRAIDG